MISWSSRDEKICAIYLNKALVASKKGEVDVAEENITRAKSIMPSFSECYRIHSFLLKDTSPYKAESEMEKAIELSPNSVLTRYAYAQLLIHEEDFPRAYDQIEYALSIDSDDIALKTCKAWILTLNGNYEPAACLYDELLYKQSDRHRKFRVSTYDQAASCYKRWAEQYFKDNDFTECKNKISKAIDFLGRAIEINDYDHGTIKRLCDILIMSGNYSSKSNDLSLVKSILYIFESNFINFTVNIIQALRAGLEKFESYYPSICEHELGHLVDKARPVYSNSKERILGTIERVNMTERGVSYGFLNGIDDQRYFFHRSELKPNSFLDKEHRNKNVTFISSQNDKGLCAVHIKEDV